MHTHLFTELVAHSTMFVSTISLLLFLDPLLNSYTYQAPFTIVINQTAGHHSLSFPVILKTSIQQTRPKQPAFHLHQQSLVTSASSWTSHHSPSIIIHHRCTSDHPSICDQPCFFATIHFRWLTNDSALINVAPLQLPLCHHYSYHLAKNRYHWCF